MVNAIEYYTIRLPTVFSDFISFDYRDHQNNLPFHIHLSGFIYNSDCFSFALMGDIYARELEAIFIVCMCVGVGV